MKIVRDLDIADASSVSWSSEESQKNSLEILYNYQLSNFGIEFIDITNFKLLRSFILNNNSQDYMLNKLIKNASYDEEINSENSYNEINCKLLRFIKLIVFNVKFQTKKENQWTIKI